MASNYTFNTPAGQGIMRELNMLCINVGTPEEPIWKAVGSGVPNSSAEYDWGEESAIDILGNNNVTMKKPVITQSFDPCPIKAGDQAIMKVWETAIAKQDYSALASMDVLDVHLYAGVGFRYMSSMIKPTSLGGDGGGTLSMPFEVIFGGTRVEGTVSKNGEDIVFTPEAESI